MEQEISQFLLPKTSPKPRSQMPYFSFCQPRVSRQEPQSYRSEPRTPGSNFLKLSTAQAWGAFKNGEASHIIFPYPTPTLPYPTLPYTTLPNPTLPFPTLPFHSLPYPTLSYPRSQVSYHIVATLACRKFSVQTITLRKLQYAR